MENVITPTLDRIEKNLPPIPRGLFRLNRAVLAVGYNAANALCSATRTASDTATTGARTVKGQAESVADRVAATARHGAREVVGQTKAQVSETVDVAQDETVALLDSATEALENDPTGSYESWTKSELYERAQELDIDGRSSMAKADLIDALRSA